MSAFSLLISPATLVESPSSIYRTLPYHWMLPSNPQLRLTVLAPLHLPCRTTRPVSYYAFFKGWLLLSQPPGCLCLSTSFSTELPIWDLSRRSGLLPFSRRTLSPAVCLQRITHRYSQFASVGRSTRPPSRSSALPPVVLPPGATSIAFEENQLSPSLISLSLLATSHPRLFQQTWVRTSSTCYRTFILLMARSPGFGSIPSDLTPF